MITNFFSQNCAFYPSFESQSIIQCVWLPYNLLYTALLDFDSIIFPALHGMLARTSYKKGVRLSVRLSKEWIVTKRKKRSVHIFTPHERSLSLVF